jgi:mono/diheme cytochrome c family protein
MNFNFVFWLLMVAVSALFGWLTWRSWHARHVFVKWGGVIVSGLLTLVMAGISVITLIGLVKAYAPKNIPIPDLTVAGTPEQIRRGEHLANAFCVDCHSTNRQLPLSGGKDMGPDFPMPLGSFVPSNLTPGRELKDWSDGEIMRLLRSGIDTDGRKLMVMSNVNVRHMSDEDLESVIAYLRSQPAVSNETPDPPDRATLLGIVLLGAGMLPEGEAPVTGPIIAPPKGVTVEYGEYMVGFQDCRDCHGEDLNGGKPGQLAPIGPPLAVVKSWTQEEFISTFRTGIDPSGSQISESMPWDTLGRLDDVELAAMHAYLSSLP